MSINQTAYQILGNHRFIDKYKKRQNEWKIAGCVSSFAYFCVVINDVIIKKAKNDFSSSFLFWTVTFICLAASFALASNCARQIKRYELKNYELEKEDLETKKWVAKVKKESLPDYIANMKIKRPDPKVAYPITFFVILFFFHILMLIMVLSVK